MPDSWWPHGPQPTRFPCPWDFPGKDTGVGRHFLLQGIFPTQGSNQVSCTAGRFFTYWATREAVVNGLLPCNYFLPVIDELPIFWITELCRPLLMWVFLTASPLAPSLLSCACMQSAAQQWRAPCSPFHPFWIMVSFIRCGNSGY